jgi:O-antigen/teichoic acid export membrane protein
VTVLEKISAIWKEDHLLRRVVKNSSYLFSSNALSAVLSFLQTIVAVRLIGVTNWGLVATIQTFASNVNRLLSFRMSEVVVKHLTPALGEKNNQEAAVLVKAAGLTEAVTSVVAFIVLVLFTPLAARIFAKDAGAAPWFTFYGLILLSNLVYETSTGVLQVTRRFDHLARTNFVQSVVTASLIVGVYFTYRLTGLRYYSYLLPAILLAYVLGKTYVGLSLAIVALRELNARLGSGWWRIPLRTLAHKRSLALFALNTNLNGTVNVLFRDNIQLYLAALLSTTEVGYFKIAMTLIIPITLVLDPLIAPTYAEISRTIANLEWEATLRLLRRITMITGGVVAAMWGFWALTGWWLIPLIYKSQARPVYPALLILLVGYGFAGIFQWNRPLSLSLGKSGFPVVVSALTGVVEVVLIFLLVPRYGYLMMALLLALYFMASIGIITLRGLQEIRHRRLVPNVLS